MLGHSKFLHNHLRLLGKSGSAACAPHRDMKSECINPILPYPRETIRKLFAQGISLGGWLRPRQHHPPAGVFFISVALHAERVTARHLENESKQPEDTSR